MTSHGDNLADMSETKQTRIEQDMYGRGIWTARPDSGHIHAIKNHVDGNKITPDNKAILTSDWKTMTI